MRIRPFRLLLAFVLLVPCAAMLALYFAFDQRPALERSADFTPENIERAKRIVDSNAPRRLRNGTVRTVTVRAEDLDLALNYLVHRYANGSAMATMDDAQLHVTLSVRASWLPLRPYVNLNASIDEGAPLPSLGSVWVGSLPVPASLARFAIDRAMATVFSEGDRQVVTQALRGTTFAPDAARFTYQWDDELGETVRGAFVQSADRERLEQYQRALAETSQRMRPGSVSLIDLLKPLFVLASERSGASDPVTENRAAILVLTFYVVGLPLRDIAPEAATWPRPRRLGVALNKRGDSAQHFMVSAMLAANAGGPFSDAVGLYKEVADSRGGSGFSFNDLAADRAGRRLGQMAEDPTEALRLQARMSVATHEREIMPEASDLPESMSEGEFTRRFGGLNGPAYASMVADIDQRIGALALYR